MPHAQPKTDAEFRAHQDAFTLSEAEIINNDPKRLKAAQKAAKEILPDKEEEVEGMRVIASASTIKAN